MPTDKQITNYINAYYTENFIRFTEDTELQRLKIKYERTLLEQDNLEWLNFSNKVCERRTGEGK